jgi:hypothetical protein
MAFNVTISGQNFSVKRGDLADPALALQDESTFQTVSNVLAAVLDQPISAINTDSLTASLAATQNYSWQQKNGHTSSLQFGVSPTAAGAVTIRKDGTVFPSDKPDIQGDPGTQTQIDVPFGKAYVSISFLVSLSVSGPASFSSGQFGIKGGIDSSDRFTLANHLIFDVNTPIRTALQQAFERFRFPFGAQSSAGIESMNNGDLIESEFIGDLNLNASATYGFNHAFFGAAASAALTLAANSPIGSILAKANPTIDLGVTFTIGYEHYDAFRLLILVHAGAVELQVFKIDSSDLKTGVNASVTIDPGFTLNVEDNLPGLLKNTAAQLVSHADPQVQNAFNSVVGNVIDHANQPLQQAADDINSAIPNVIKKLPSLGVAAGVAFERLPENTVLANYVFPRPLNPDAWRAAMLLDLRTASQFPGVTLGAGSYVKNELTKTSTLSFTFFGLRAQTIEQYQKEAVFEYAGNNMFHFRSKQGIGASSDIFGRLQNADFYFTVAADMTVTGRVNSTDIKMVFVSGSTNNPNKTRNMSFTLDNLIPNSSSLTRLLADQTAHNAQLPVRLTATFAFTAFSKIAASQFQNGKPQPKDHQAQDARNFSLFVEAVNSVGGPFGQFPPQVASYNAWAQVNANLFGDPDHTPDRRATNPMLFTNPQQAYAGLFDGEPDSTLQRFSGFLEEARHFMNLCADLQNLAATTNVTDTLSLAQLADSLDNILKLDASIFPLFFLNAVLVALVRHMHAQPVSVAVPLRSDTPLTKFDVAIAYA